GLLAFNGLSDRFPNDVLQHVVGGVVDDTGLSYLRLLPLATRYRSTWRNSSRPPSLLSSPPLKSASMTRRPKRPKSCSAYTLASAVLGCHRGSDTYDNGLSHEAADLLLMKYPG